MKDLVGKVEKYRFDSVGNGKTTHSLERKNQMRKVVLAQL